MTTNYLFESRKEGYWRNSYESAIILSNIVGDLAKKGDVSGETQMSLNGKKVDKLPFTTVLSADTPVVIKQDGVTPLFVTAYQKRWEEKPKVESSKGFELSTWFVDDKDTVSYLENGKTLMLRVKLELSGDAEFVSIEVPIPAGCSYGTKKSWFFWGDKESHREYFREKVVIFCESLSKGEHTFEIELQPRFEGEYSLNPAKAELFYFPTFYGNNGLTTIEQKEPAEVL